MPSFLPFNIAAAGEGDSIMAQTDGRSIHSWIALMLDGRLRFLPAIALGTFGTGGDQLQDIMDDVSGVIAAGCRLVIMDGGTNDPLTTASLPASKALATQIVNTYNAAGVHVVYIAIPPRTDTSHVGVASREANRLDFNAWLEGLAAGRGLTVVNVDDVYSPSDSVQSVDRLHPRTEGAYRIAAKVAAVLSPMLGTGDVAAAIGGAQLLNNPALAGTTGTLATGVSGQAPTGWIVDNDTGATVVSSLLPSGSGNTWCLDVSGSATTSTQDLRIYQTVSHPIAVGDQFALAARMLLAGLGGEGDPTGVLGWSLAGFKAQIFSQFNAAGSGPMTRRVDNLVRCMPFANTTTGASSQVGLFLRFAVGPVAARIEFSTPHCAFTAP